MTAVPQVDPRDVPAGATIIDATGAKHITLGTIAERLEELPAPGEDFYVICHGGGRSNRAATFLREHGYAAHNIAGGTSAWFAAGLPMTSENGEAPAVVH